jgi:hypothetical protein
LRTELKIDETWLSATVAEIKSDAVSNERIFTINNIIIEGY